MSLTRRELLASLGASAAVACAPERIHAAASPRPHAGTSVYFRTTCRACDAGCGVVARVVDGRVVKLEGDPEHAATGGALCARGQAQARAPYAAGRELRPSGASWEQALSQASELLGGASSVVVLSRPVAEPMGRRLDAWAGRWGGGVVHLLDPDGVLGLAHAAHAQLGVRGLPVYPWPEQGVVLTVGGDLFLRGVAPVAHARAIAQLRAGERVRHVHISAQRGLTGASADRWLAVPPGGEARVVHALQVLAQGSPLPSEEWGLPTKVLQGLAEQLRGGLCLGASSGTGWPELAQQVLALNTALGAQAQVHTVAPNAGAPLPDGPIDVLLLVDVDAQVPQGLIERAGAVIQLGQRPLPSARVFLPTTHWLETFGEVARPTGGVGVQQAVARAPDEVRDAADVLNALAGVEGEPAYADAFAERVPRGERQAGRREAEAPVAATPAAPPPAPSPPVTTPHAVARVAVQGANPRGHALPDPLTGLRDDPAVHLHSSRAAGLVAGHAVVLSVGSRSITAPWRIDEGLHPLAVAVPLAALAALGGFGPVDVASGAELPASPTAPAAVAPSAPAPRVGLDAAHPQRRWVLSVDLDKCTGCSACVVACSVENNVSPAGPLDPPTDWLRVQHSPQAGFVPSMCQQCGQAPCVPPCPVVATYHTAEGVTADVHRQCQGMGYCATSCPYEARVLPDRHARARLPTVGLNPDVAPRLSAVVEKCTFCHHRVLAAERSARLEGRSLGPNEVVPACAQTCPTDAIHFGDSGRADAAVTQHAADPRARSLLPEEATAPGVVYLARREGEA